MSRKMKCGCTRYGKCRKEVHYAVQEQSMVLTVTGVIIFSYTRQYEIGAS
jgi:hypothetical protein